MLEYFYAYQDTELILGNKRLTPERGFFLGMANNAVTLC
jgi:hypothetical protein